MELLSDKSIRSLHKKYAPHPRAFEVVYGHCQIIDEIAGMLIARASLKLDQELVHVAAMLHDVGYYKLYDDSGYVPKSRLIRHGVVGYQLLVDEGLPEAVCRIAERHTGIGLTRKHILDANLPLPPRDLVPETAEEWLILFADKFHTKSVTITNPQDSLGRFNTFGTYLEHTRQFGEENVRRFTELVNQFGEPDLKALSRKHNQPVDPPRSSA